MAASKKRTVVLNVLDKMEIEYTAKISEASAIKKLKRAIDGGEEIPELTKAEIKLLKDLGYDVEIEEDEEVEPTDEDLEEIEEEEEEKKPAKKKTRKKKSSSKKKSSEKKAPAKKKKASKKKKSGPRVTNQTIVNEMLQEGASEKKIFAKLKKVYAEKGKDLENEKDLEWIQGRTDIYIRIGKAQLMMD